MVYEVVQMKVDPSRRDEYVQAYRNALRAWLANEPGWHGGKIMRCVEDPSLALAILEWDSVEAHTGLRGTPPHQRFLETINRYLTTPATPVHFVAEEL